MRQAAERNRRHQRWWYVPALCAGFMLAPPVAADDSGFSEAAALVEKGAFSEALLRFERLSDEGFVHPDASFNRALAYLRRADSAGAKPGDLGQAVAGLREADALREDPEAEHLVETVRQVISRQRAARGKDPVVVAPPLWRAFSELVAPSVWAALSLALSVVLSVSLVVRRHTTGATKLGADVATMSSAGLLCVCGTLFAVTEHYHSAWREAVVIAEHATLRDSDGKPLTARALDTSSDEVPEGASVYVVSQLGRLLQVQWGGSRAWLREGEVRLLARP